MMAEGCCEYEPPESLWRLITAHIAESEWPEVKIMLGEDLVEQSTELQEEVSTLLDIWKEYRAETEHSVLQRPNRLPEPPAARDRLKQEIQFFVSTLQDKAKENGRDPELILSRHNSEIIDYALDSGYSSGSLPSTGRSSGRSTPMRRLHTPETPRTSRGAGSVKEEIAAMNDKLSVYKIDTVVEHLQQVLQEEVDTLLADTEFLQGCLDDEADIRCQSSMGISREPSLADMREERSKLEKELLSPESPVHGSIQDSAKAPPRKMPSSLTPKAAPLNRPASASRSLAPLKASHSIKPTTLKLTTQADTAATASSSSQKHTVRRTGQFSQRTSSATSTASTSSGGIADLTRNLSHVTIRTGSKTSATVLQVGGESASSSSVPAEREKEGSRVPVPPSKPKSGTHRPRSAQRFRNMVLECREGGT